jgi:hypothetical protein
VKTDPELNRQWLDSNFVLLGNQYLRSKTMFIVRRIP